jgi:hypothetical protein
MITQDGAKKQITSSCSKILIEVMKKAILMLALCLPLAMQAQTARQAEVTLAWWLEQIQNPSQQMRSQCKKLKMKEWAFKMNKDEGRTYFLDCAFARGVNLTTRYHGLYMPNFRTVKSNAMAIYYHDVGSGAWFLLTADKSLLDSYMAEARSLGYDYTDIANAGEEIELLKNGPVTWEDVPAGGGQPDCRRAELCKPYKGADGSIEEISYLSFSVYPNALVICLSSSSM